MILASVRKNLVSALRGEYVDFVISRVTFTVFTLLTSLMLLKLNGGRVSPEFQSRSGGGDFLAFVMTAGLLYAYTESVFLNVSRVMMTELRAGTLEAVFMAPFARWKYYLGSQLAQLLMMTLDVGVIAIACVFLPVTFAFGFPEFALGMLLLSVVLLAFSVVTSLVMIAFRDTFFIQNTILPVLLIAGGYLFPLDYLPLPVRAVFASLPLADAVKLVRSGLYGCAVSIEASRYAFDLCVSFALLALGLALYPRFERRAVESLLS